MAKVMEEKETRKKLLAHARRIGAEEDLKQLFDKWDRLLALAPPNEKEDISKMGILDIQMLLDITNTPDFEGLTVNGKVVMPSKKKFVE